MGVTQDRNAVAATSTAAVNASITARLMGSGCGGFFELALFHPIDTVAKRLMTNKLGSSFSYSQVIFKNAADAPFWTKWCSLFPGIGFGFAYKVLQRMYKFGGQPYMYEYLSKHHSDTFTTKTMQQAVSGSIMGVGEVFLLPLDVLKIKSQTRPAVLAGRGVISIFQTEGFALYSGWQWTMMRNAPGSFALFGGNSVAKKMMGLEETLTGKATVVQNFLSSMVGSVSSIAVAQPFDIIKTRIQNRPFDSPKSGNRIIRSLLKDEGVGAFFKGITPKMLVVGPKLVMSMTIAQSLISYFQDTGY